MPARNTILLALAAGGLFGCASSAPVNGAALHHARLRFISPRMQECVDRALHRDPDHAVLGDARARFEAGCDLGDAAACSLLGVLYERGLGVTRNGDAARALFGRACDAGNKMGCKHLQPGELAVEPPKALVQGSPAAQRPGR